jgi:hypothetical protein
MSPQPQKGPVEGGLSCSPLRVADDPNPIENLRQVLSSFNHRCRNSLNGIKIGLYLFKHKVDGPMPASWSDLERSYQEIEVLFDRLQMIYRPLSLTVVRSPMGRLIDERLPAWRSWFGIRGKTLELTRPAVDPPGDFDPMHLGMGLDAFVASRAALGHAAWKTQLSWGIADGFFEVRWQESRPMNGSLGSKHENGQVEHSRAKGRIESLAHSLLGRIIAEHGGFLESIDDPAFSVTIRWPQFQCSDPRR